MKIKIIVITKLDSLLNSLFYLSLHIIVGACTLYSKMTQVYAYKLGWQTFLLALMFLFKIFHAKF